MLDWYPYNTFTILFLAYYQWQLGGQYLRFSFAIKHKLYDHNHIAFYMSIYTCNIQYYRLVLNIIHQIAKQCIKKLYDNTLMYYRNVGHIFHLDRNWHHSAVIDLYLCPLNCCCMTFESNKITLKSNRFLICITCILSFLKTRK